jgi:hypothetical protein
MMPVIRISDATFVDLRSIATWLGTNTPSETIDSLVREKMDTLHLERDVEEASLEQSGDPIVFEETPGLSHTRILAASVNSRDIGKTTWSGLLLSMIQTAYSKGLSGQDLVNTLQIPAKVGVITNDGYKFYPDLGISVQGQSAADAWREVRRLADKFSVPVEVRFQWRDKDKAQYPGRIGIIKAGK